MRHTPERQVRPMSSGSRITRVLAAAIAALILAATSCGEVEVNVPLEDITPSLVSHTQPEFFQLVQCTDSFDVDHTLQMRDRTRLLIDDELIRLPAVNRWAVDSSCELAVIVASTGDGGEDASLRVIPIRKTRRDNLEIATVAGLGDILTLRDIWVGDNGNIFAYQLFVTAQGQPGEFDFTIDFLPTASVIEGASGRATGPDPVESVIATYRDSVPIGATTTDIRGREATVGAILN